MAGEFLSVPGNIKQVFLPFVLNPDNAINKTPISVSNDGKSIAAGEGTTQLFTFRKSMKEGGDIALLRIAPSSFYNENQFIVRNDISYRLLYGSDPSTKASADPYSDMLENLPRITIREYLQDAKLDQMMNLFSEIGKGFSAGANAAKSEDGSGRSFWDTIKFGAAALAKNGLSGGKVLIDNMSKVMYDIFRQAFDDNSFTALKTVTADRHNDDYSKFVLKIPYLLYYRIISATSTNIYEIPYSGQVLYESNGSNGWKSHNLLDGFETAGKSMLGTLANWVGKNIKVNTTPTWDGASDETGIKVDIEFSLFNDSKEGAVKNFIFVNTIVPGSMWMQYHVFQHAPNLYDIRIEGVKRLFMCSGDFKVEQVGVLRKPSKAFCEELKKYVNKNSYAKKLDIEDLVRVPDMYKVTCTFTSLLPNNFNNYLYTYYNNAKINTISGAGLHEKSALENVLADAAKELHTIFTVPDQAENAYKSEKPPQNGGYLDDVIKNLEAKETNAANASK